MNINHISFNNTKTHLTCSTDLGYNIYSLHPNLEKKISSDIGGVSIMKIYNKTNIIVAVGGGPAPFKSKDCVVLRNQIDGQNLIEIDMREQIRNIIIYEKKLLIVLDKKICIFDWNGTMKTFRETYLNETGLCVMNFETETVVTLGTKKGEITVWDTNSDTSFNIDAHLTNIEAIAISSNGKYVATASETGTLIRVVNTGTKVIEYEFRRGSQPAGIYDICFNEGSNLIACYSSNGTIHLFDLNNNPYTTKNTLSVLSSVKNYLPSYFSSQWSFKQINLGNQAKSICCFDSDNNIHVVSMDGLYYKIIGADGKFEDIIYGKLYPNY